MNRGYVSFHENNIFLHTPGFTTAPRSETESVIPTWWQLQCDPITSRGFIYVLSGGMVNQFCDLIQGKDESSKLNYGTWSRWCQVHIYPCIWGCSPTDLFQSDHHLHVPQNTGYSWTRTSDGLFWSLSLYKVLYHDYTHKLSLRNTK